MGRSGLARAHVGPRTESKSGGDRDNGATRNAVVLRCLIEDTFALKDVGYACVEGEQPPAPRIRHPDRPLIQFRAGR